MKFNIFIFIILTTIGCSPKYFPVPTDDFIATHISTCKDFESYTKYEFNLRPHDIFKNGEKTTLLLSDNTDVKHFLFNLPLQDTSYLGTPIGLANAFYNLTGYVQTAHEDSLWKVGNKVLIKSIAGKNVALDDRKAKIYRIFSGKVGPSRGNIAFIYINHIYELNEDQKSDEKIFDEPPLIVLAEMVKIKGVFQINVHALIDKGYKNKARDPIIYEFSKIFGSEVTLVKK